VKKIPLNLLLGAGLVLGFPVFAIVPISFEPLVYTAPVEGVVPSTNSAPIPSASRPTTIGSVLLVGDSLSVGPFGDNLVTYFRQKLEPSQFCAYAACGSSPENWLKDAPDFITPCGFRVVTARESWKTDYHNGIKPRRVRTPKLAAIVPKQRPQLVIVQLGTNWMDEFVNASDLSGESKKRIIRKFIAEIRTKAAPQVQIVWILPPDSSKYSSRIKDAVDRWITDCAKELNFKTINTRGFTDRYIKGKSGSDGVHLNDTAGAQWAGGVIKRLPKVSAASVTKTPVL
jgi:lysophospholipase L1-like esterase